MGSLKQFLVCGIIALSCVTILELSFTGFLVVKYFNQLSWWNLTVTLLINLFIIFFAITSIVGATSNNFGLLITCLAYSIVELVRSSINIYDTWNDYEEKNFKKIFVTFDAGKKTLNDVIFSNNFKKFHRDFSCNDCIFGIAGISQSITSKENNDIINWKKSRQSVAGNFHLIKLYYETKSS